MIDNLVFHPTEPRVIGILDWELSTVGHPLSDLANLLQPYYVPSYGRSLENFPMTGLRNNNRLLAGLPAVEELIDAYRKMTGAPAINRWEFCVAFALFRLAVITQGIAARVALGQASSAEARAYASMFRPISYLALEYVNRGDLVPASSQRQPSRI